MVSLSNHRKDDVAISITASITFEFLPLLCII